MNLDLSRLKDKFPPDSIEWRIQRSGNKNGQMWGMVLAYVTNRAIQDRLDDVCGPGGWRNEYTTAPDGGILCGISIKVGEEWVTKWDGAENTDIEPVKGGLSNAMKRAAVQWGIGRYLYRLETTFVQGSDNGKFRAFDKASNTAWKWNPPDLPDWALPEKLFRDLPLDRQHKARAMFFAMCGELGVDPYKYADQHDLLGYCPKKKRPSIGASTEAQVARAVNYLKISIEKQKKNGTPVKAEEAKL